MLKSLLALARCLSTPQLPPQPSSTPADRLGQIQGRLDEICGQQPPVAKINWLLVLARLAGSVWFTPLVALLDTIQANEANYAVRNPLIIQAVSMALRLGMRAGFRLDPQEPEWPVAYIELPTGQVSWHLPQHSVAYDGHTTAQKYQRCRELAQFALLAPAASPAPAAAEAPPQSANEA